MLQVTGRPLAEDVESVRSPFAANMLESLLPSKPQSIYDDYRMMMMMMMMIILSVKFSLFESFPAAMGAIVTRLCTEHRYAIVKNY